MLRVVKGVIVAAAMLFSSVLWGEDNKVVLETSVQGGRKWAEIKSNGETDGSQIHDAMASVRIQPLSHIPVSVGPAVIYSVWSVDNLAGVEIDKISHYELGLEGKTWLELSKSVSPYSKVRYVLDSKGKGYASDDEFDLEWDFRTEGFYLALGSDFKITENFGLLLEAALGVEMLRVTDGKVTFTSESALKGMELDIDKGRRMAFNSKSLLLGMDYKF